MIKSPLLKPISQDSSNQSIELLNKKESPPLSSVTASLKLSSIRSRSYKPEISNSGLN